MFWFGGGLSGPLLPVARRDGGSLRCIRDVRHGDVQREDLRQGNVQHGPREKARRGAGAPRSPAVPLPVVQPHPQAGHGSGRPVGRHRSRCRLLPGVLRRQRPRFDPVLPVVGLLPGLPGTGQPGHGVRLPDRRPHRGLPVPLLPGCPGRLGAAGHPGVPPGPAGRVRHEPVLRLHRAHLQRLPAPWGRAGDQLGHRPGIRHVESPPPC